MSLFLADEQVSLAYTELRSRVIDLLRGTSASDAELVVAHCPNWRVRDLAAHLIGVPDDIVNGRMEGVASDAWTAAQVARHSAKPLTQIADELAKMATQFDAMLPHFPATARSQMVMDAVTHEHDLRHALGKPGARDSLAVRAGLAWFAERIHTDFPNDYEMIFGVGLSNFDLIRCLTGRRSLAQAQALGLSSDAIASLKKIQAGSPLRAPAQDLTE